MHAKAAEATAREVPVGKSCLIRLVKAAGKG
jgi:hypothetical protein